MQQPEAKFKAALVKAYTAVFPLGWYNYNQANRRAGIPDLYFTVPKPGGGVLPVWIEAKVEDRKPTKLQVAVMARMARAGNRTLWASANCMTKSPKHRTVDLGWPDSLLSADFPWAAMATQAFWNKVATI